MVDTSVDQLFAIDELENAAERLAAEYRSAQPFPHIVLDNFLRPEVIEILYDEFSAIDPTTWTNYLHVNEKKFGHTRPEAWGNTLRAVADAFLSARFVSVVESITEISGLIGDEKLDGGGLHRSLAGGFLNVHADFTAHHAVPNWRRRVNLLLYVNRDWEPAWGGDLELWAQDVSRCVTKIRPVGNRVVLFTTSDDSYHGHPDPMTCPAGVARQSMALYYFTEEAREHVHSTNYRARPGDGLKAIPIYLDKLALRAYDTAKRRLHLDDDLVSRWLGRRR